MDETNWAEWLDFLKGYNETKPCIQGSPVGLHYSGTLDPALLHRDLLDRRIEARVREGVVNTLALVSRGLHVSTTGKS